MESEISTAVVILMVLNNFKFKMICWKVHTSTKLDFSELISRIPRGNGFIGCAKWLHILCSHSHGLCKHFLLGYYLRLAFQSGRLSPVN